MLVLGTAEAAAAGVNVQGVARRGEGRRFRCSMIFDSSSIIDRIDVDGCDFGGETRRSARLRDYSGRIAIIFPVLTPSY